MWLENLLLIVVGGAAGANLRYLAGRTVPGLGGTLLVNALGSFLLGALLYGAVYTDVLTAKRRLVLGTGFLSSFTTYSTFAVETATSAPLLAVGNVAGNYALGVAGVVLGELVARRVGAER